MNVMHQQKAGAFGYQSIRQILL